MIVSYDAKLSVSYLHVQLHYKRVQNMTLRHVKVLSSTKSAFGFNLLLIQTRYS